MGRAVDSLKEICARAIGQSLPFELVLIHPQKVPEDLQERVAFWAFPTDEETVLRFLNLSSVDSETSLRSSKDSTPSRQIQERIKLNITQIGMHITAEVYPDKKLAKPSTRVYHPSIRVDRGCITEYRCSCQAAGVCSHVKELCMARMHMDCVLRVHAPLSESLNHLDGSQLQKLVQYLAEKTPRLIPSLQGLVSELQDPKSEINAIDGAPDPTAGGLCSERAFWYLDRVAIKANLKRNYEKIIQGLGATDRETHRRGPTINSVIKDLPKYLLGIEQFLFQEESGSVFPWLLQCHHEEGVLIALEWSLEMLTQNVQKKIRASSSCNIETLFAQKLCHLVEVFAVNPLVSKDSKLKLSDMIAKYSSNILPECVAIHSHLKRCSTILELQTVGNLLLKMLTCQTTMETDLSFIEACKLQLANNGFENTNLSDILSVLVAIVRFHNVYKRYLDVSSLLYPLVERSYSSFEEVLRQWFLSLQEMDYKGLIDFTLVLMQALDLSASDSQICQKVSLAALTIAKITQVYNQETEWNKVYIHWACNGILKYVVSLGSQDGQTALIKDNQVVQLLIKHLKATIEGMGTPTEASLSRCLPLMELIATIGNSEYVKDLTQEILGRCSNGVSSPTIYILRQRLHNLLVTLLKNLQLKDSMKLLNLLESCFPHPPDIRTRSILERIKEWPLPSVSQSQNHFLPYFCKRDITEIQTKASDTSLDMTIDCNSLFIYHMAPSLNKAHTVFVKELSDAATKLEDIHPLVCLKLNLFSHRVHRYFTHFPAPLLPPKDCVAATVKKVSISDATSALRLLWESWPSCVSIDLIEALKYLCSIQADSSGEFQKILTDIAVFTIPITSLVQQFLTLLATFATPDCLAVIIDQLLLNINTETSIDLLILAGNILQFEVSHKVKGLIQCGSLYTSFLNLLKKLSNTQRASSEYFPGEITHCTSLISQCSKEALDDYVSFLQAYGYPDNVKMRVAVEAASIMQNLARPQPGELASIDKNISFLLVPPLSKICNPVLKEMKERIHGEIQMHANNEKKILRIIQDLCDKCDSYGLNKGYVFGIIQDMMPSCTADVHRAVMRTFNWLYE